MRCRVLTEAYDALGWHPTLSAIGDLLEKAAEGIECGIITFDLTLCLRPVGPPRPGLEELHAESLARFGRPPRLHWSLAKRRLSLRYGSRLGTGSGLDTGPPSRTLLLAAVQELAEILKAKESALSRKPGLDTGSFLALITSLPEAIPATDADLLAFLKVRHAEREAERQKLPWWEQLGIDWEDYHPAARDLLDDPFFWRDDDDDAPHGNDSGADLFHSFRAWRRSHRTATPARFLEEILEAWEVSTEWRQRPMEIWGRDAELGIEVHDEAAIALAFALVKLEGSCDTAVRDLALAAIARQSDADVARHFGWPVQPARLQALATMKTVLQAL